VDVPLQPYFVPVCTAGDADTLVIRTGRQPRGTRVGIAFTRADRLVAAMGKGQQWTRLSESALRALLLPLGISGIQVDPILVGSRITPTPVPTVAPSRLAGGATARQRADLGVAEVVGR
jgi:hypothetical protein